MLRKPYPTDLTDEQWERLRPLLPSLKSGTRRGGRPAADTGEVVNAILYLLRAGGSWRLLPHDFPCWETVSSRFRLWRLAVVWERAHAARREEVREAGHPPTPETLWVDSQTVTTTQRGGPKRYDGRKKGGRPQAIRGRGLARPDLGVARHPGQRPGPGRREVAAGGRPAVAATGAGGDRRPRVQQAVR